MDRPTWGDTVRIRNGAPLEVGTERLAAVCGIGQVENDDQAKEFDRPVGTTLLLVEIGNGRSFEIPEDLVEVANE